MAGDRLVGRDGVESVVREVADTGEWATVYNFRVSAWHTYFVGAAEWGFDVWAHNADYKSKLTPVTAGESGSYSSLAARSRVGDGLTPHHIPQAALGRTGYNEGGALVMKQLDHAATRTYGGRGIGTAAADATTSFRDLLAKDIKDVRKVLGGESYNRGLLDLIKYYRVNFPGLLAR